jgi:O-antigen/teichoic acid export membrane protein
MADRPPPEARDPKLTVDQVKQRAVEGTVTLGARSVLIFGLGLVGNVVLARLLVPRDFGLVALGTTLVTVVRLISEAGIGAALIGRREPPERDELEGVLGLQLAATVGASVCFAAAAWPFGRDGLVLALMLTALPLASLRLPTALVLERELSYRVIAKAEVVEAASNYIWAIATVAAGLGVWGLASAAPVRVLLGSAAMIRWGPLGFVRPRWAWRRIRPLLGFGVRLQAINAVTALRDQGLNVGIAAIGGIATLGLWSFAFRIMQVPFLLLFSVWRVSYPAMSRLLGADEDPRPVIERGIGVVAVAVSPILVGIGASAHALLPPLVGERWSGSADILLWASLAMMVSAPVTVPGVGYMLAAGQASKLLLSAVAGAIAWLGLALSLLVPVGASAIGLGWLATSLVEAFAIGWWVARGSGARVIASLARPLAVAVAAGAVGFAVASLGHEGVLMGIGGLLAAELLLVAGLFGLAGEQLRATLRLSSRAVASVRAP